MICLTRTSSAIRYRVRFRTSTVVAAALTAVAACSSPRDLPPGASRAEVEQWRRDSTVIDSIAATVQVDSMYRIYRTMLTATNPSVFESARLCELARLSRLHGEKAANLAVARMEDTVWEAGESARVREMERKLDAGYIVTIDSSCHWSGPVAPERVGSTQLNGTHRPPWSTEILP